MNEKEIGDIEIDERFFGYDKYRVLTEDKGNLKRFVEFRSWENAIIFSEIVKIRYNLNKRRKRK